jgi:hypothetical protein
MVAVVALFVLVLSVLAGLWTGADVAMRGRALEHERVQVNAVVLHAAAPSDPEVDADPTDWVSVQYTDDAGQVHEADVHVVGPSSAGTVVQLWMDRAGRLASPPPGPVDAVVSGTAVGLGFAAAGWLVLGVVWTVVRRVVDAWNAALWAREWEIVEPGWSGRRH